MTDRAFLAVEASLTGRRWTGPTEADLRAAEAIAQGSGLSPALSRILAQRGVAPGAAQAFLAPSLRDLLPDPMTLRDMGRSEERRVGKECW